LPLKTALNKVPRDLRLYFLILAAWVSTTAMHIPDGYLSPSTSIIMFLLALPFWLRGIRKARQDLNARNVPLIALMAAFSFVIMMFNVPLPGGTSGHAVGAALAAVVLGPEIATLAVSIALVIQAFFFGDGGILAIGANCFNMAVVVPYLSYAVYRVFSRNQPITSSRRLVGAALGGWVGLTVAAFAAGVEFGLQPLLFSSPDGTPLYAPYPLSISVPAMVIPHALGASVVEGMVTALVLAYLQRTNPAILQGTENPSTRGEGTAGAKLRWLWVALIVLIVASPLGLLATGTAWGEWTAQKLASMGVKIPQGLARLERLWNAPFSGYQVRPFHNAGLGYSISALLGILIILLAAWLLLTLLTTGKKEQSRSNGIERNLRGISETMERSLFADEINSRPGLLQGLDPRTKLCTVFLLILAASLAHNLPTLIGLYFGVLLLAWFSRIPLWLFIKRVWLFLPFFTGMIILPALFITPGPALAELPFGLAISKTGLETVVFLLFRVSVSVSLATLLILTTPWNAVLNALSVLHVPDIVILILGMTYRYIFLLLQSANDMFLSRQSRVVGPLKPAEQRRVIAATSAALFNKTLDLSGEVYLAMQSRGFRGVGRSLKPAHMQARDWAWGALFTILTFLVILVGRM
jgi:cobalt/nickel transport system permease protein